MKRYRINNYGASPEHASGNLEKNILIMFAKYCLNAMEEHDSLTKGPLYNKTEWFQSPVSLGYPFEFAVTVISNLVWCCLPKIASQSEH